MEYAKDTEPKEIPKSLPDTKMDRKDVVFVRFLYNGTIVRIVHVVVIS